MSRQLTRQELVDMAAGAAIMATGGGGDPLVGRLLVQQALDEGLTVEIISPEELDDDAFVISTAMMGAPSVVVEKLANGNEAVTSLRKLEAHLGKTATATVPMECGGLNSMIPLLVAARAGIPVVDADGMGRAFPELQMETFGVYGISGSPLVISDEKGHSVLVDTGDDNVRMENFARAVTIQMGGASFIAEYPMSGADLKRTGIPHTLSLASQIGRAIREARAVHADPFAALVGAVEDSIYGYATSLLEGKIVDVERSIVGGFTAGTVTLAPFDGDELLTIDFRNENVVARRGERVVALVPDLITVLDLESCTAITTEALRFGQRVRVVAISTPEIMRTPEALHVWGPHAFGVDHPWVPVEELAAETAATPGGSRP
ncbi:MAG: uncharacterized protein QOH54_3145 [Mycobacterium sp.]|jgi:DUF917 family protein|nr:uncharacterized protein [Mycobacterium sp.]MDT5288306.1 uncharacterized protein [Mycobacterium sp.]MDT5359091.1 uncharacterized protein [Mycobacterium sp.]